MKNFPIKIKIDDTEEGVSLSSSTLASSGNTGWHFLQKYIIHLGDYNYHCKLIESTRPKKVLRVGAKLADDLGLEEDQIAKLSLSDKQTLESVTFTRIYDSGITPPELISGIEILCGNTYRYNGETLRASELEPANGYMAGSTIISIAGEAKSHTSKDIQPFTLLQKKEKQIPPDLIPSQGLEKNAAATGFGEFFMKTPNRLFNELHGYDELTKQLIDILDLHTGKKKPKYEYRKNPNILLYGPPGTGKTHIAESCAAHAECSFFSFSASQFLSKWVGDSSQNVRKLFTAARENAPTVVHIDEIDAIVAHRRETYTAQVINQLRTEMDGITLNSGVIVVATTNHIEEIDPPVLSRFNHQLCVDIPDVSSMAVIIEGILSPIEEVKVNYLDLAKMLCGHSPRKIIEIRDKVCHMLNTGEKLAINMADILALIEYKAPKTLTTILKHRLS